MGWGCNWRLLAWRSQRCSLLGPVKIEMVQSISVSFRLWRPLLPWERFWVWTDVRSEVTEEQLWACSVLCVLPEWIQESESGGIFRRPLQHDQNEPLGKKTEPSGVWSALGDGLVGCMQFWSLGWEDPLAKEMTTHSSILAWEIPWTEEPGGLQSVGAESQTRLREPTTTLFFF